MRGKIVAAFFEDSLHHCEDVVLDLVGETEVWVVRGRREFVVWNAVWNAVRGSVNLNCLEQRLAGGLVQ